MGSSFSTLTSPFFNTPPKEIRHRSIHSRNRAIIVFHNDSRHVVVVSWCAYNGTTIQYVYLLPGAHYEQPSYLTHPWRFDFRYSDDMPPAIDAETGQAVVYPQSTTAPTLVTIRCANRIEWSTSNHIKEEGFKHYRSVVQTVLLTHHRQHSSYRQQLTAQRTTATCGRSELVLKSKCSATLGSIPMDVLLKILALAAPVVYEKPMKPLLPPGASRELYSEEEYTELFRDD